MPDQYELTTIRDIFEKVPADRIQDCCRELGTMLAQSKALSGLLETVGDGIGLSADDIRLKRPDTITWVDDGKGELTTLIHCGDEEVMRMEVRREANEENDRA